MKQLPGQLEGNEGLAGAGGQGEQNTVSAGCNGFQHPGDGHVLVVAPLPGAALVLKRDGGKTVTPRSAIGVGLGKGQRPQLVRAGVGGHIAFGAGGHVHAVNLLAIGGIGEAHRQFGGVALGLAHALGVRFIPGLGLHHAQLGVAVHQHIVCNVALGPLAAALQPP